MSTTVGTVDRMLRFALIAMLASAPTVAAQAFGAIGAWRRAAVGVVLAFAALFSFCAVYPMAGVRTWATARA